MQLLVALQNGDQYLPVTLLMIVIVWLEALFMESGFIVQMRSMN